MIYVYFFITCVVKWSENSVRFLKSYFNWLPDGPNSVRFLSHSVRYGMYVLMDELDKFTLLMDELDKFTMSVNE